MSAPKTSTVSAPVARLISEGRIAVKRCRHGIFMFNVNDSVIGRSLDLYGEWCETEISAAAQILRPGDTAIDVGANIGTHSVAFAQLVGPSGSVIAFEPQRHAFQMLCGNVALNALTNVQCLQQAVGAASGRILVPPMVLDAENNLGALALGQHAHGDEVDVATIDGLNLKACRLIKADVEGMEADVLLGARETIRRLQPALFVENNQHGASARLAPILQEIGYRAFWHISDYFNPDNFLANDKNVFRGFEPAVNLLCVPAAAAHVTGLRPFRGPGDSWRPGSTSGQSITG